MLTALISSAGGRNVTALTAVPSRTRRDRAASDRRQIDEKVGVSHREAQVRALRRQMRVREASLHDDSFASDADTLGLRGQLNLRDPIANPPRVVLETPFSRN